MLNKAAGGNMTKEDYAKYLMSDHWKETAKKRLEIDGYKCQMCGSYGTETNKIQVHHLSYKNLGHENIYTELVSCCSNCHKDIHSLMGRITDEHGGRMWDKSTPKVHVYTLSGLDTYEYIVEKE